MKKFLLIALGATMLLTAACAAPAAQSNTDTAALEAQLAQMEEEIADLQSQLEVSAAFLSNDFKALFIGVSPLNFGLDVLLI